VAVFSYLVIVGPIKRVVLREENGDPIVDDAPQLSGARS
jgi:ACS family glucarate transporter-like MFS transporter